MYDVHVTVQAVFVEPDQHTEEGYVYLDPQRLYSSAPQLRKTKLLLGRHPLLPFSPRTRTTSYGSIIVPCLKNPLFSPPSFGQSQSLGQVHQIPRHRGGCPPLHTCIFQHYISGYLGRTLGVTSTPVWFLTATKNPNYVAGHSLLLTVVHLYGYCSPNQLVSQLTPQPLVGCSI